MRVRAGNLNPHPHPNPNRALSRSGWQVRTAVTTGVFGKSLRLSASARQQRTLGEMVGSAPYP